MAAMNLNLEQFHKTVVENKGTALVEFWAPWCVYCRRIGPAYDKIAQQYQEALSVAKVNIDEEPGLAQQERIELVPTMVLYQDGKAVGSIVAPESKAALETFLNQHLNRYHIYDVIVIGGGPGGYTAALYAVRAGLDTLVLEKLSAGGQMAQTTQIDNYPGFEEGIDGFSLGEKMQLGAERFGAKTELAEVYGAQLTGKVKTIETSEGTFLGRTVILATGANPRPLGIAGEQALAGRGVHYCASCDGMAYRDKTVAVIGGGNSAAADAMLLSRIAKKVLLIHRGDSLQATKIYHEPLLNTANVEVHWNSTVSELLHGDRLTGIRLKDTATGAETELPCDGVFISIGRVPATERFQQELELDSAGYVRADESTRTNLPGVFAVGDVRTKALRQVVTAVADGAVAAHYAETYLLEKG